MTNHGAMDQLQQYINECRAHGQTDPDIIGALRSAGWTADQARAALAGTAPTSHSRQIPFAIAALVLVLLLGGGGFFAWKYYRVPDPVPPDEITQTLEETAVAEAPAPSPVTGDPAEAVRQLAQEYLSLQRDIGSALNPAEPLASAAAEVVPAAYYLQPYEETRIYAEAIGGFFEIGRMKDVQMAREINEQDIEYLTLAREKLQQRIETIQGYQQELSGEDDVSVLADAIGDFYFQLDNFFNQLLQYKRFNGTIHAAVRIDETIPVIDTEFELMEKLYLSDIGELTTDEEVRAYLDDVESSLKELMYTERGLFSGIVADLDQAEPSYGQADEELLQYIFGLYLKRYQLLLERADTILSLTEDAGGDIWSALVTYLYEEEERTEAGIPLSDVNEAKLISAYQQLRNESNMAGLFHDLIDQDKDIQRMVLMLEDSYDLPLEKGEDLELLLNNYRRSEEGAYMDRYKELLDKIAAQGQLEGLNNQTSSLVYVTEGEQQVEFTYYSQDVSDLDQISFTLLTPSGVTVDEAAAAADDAYTYSTMTAAGLTYVTYSVSQPAAGVWGASITDPDDAYYYFQYITDTAPTLLLSFPAEPSSRQFPQGDGVVVQLATRDTRPILDLEISGVVTGGEAETTLVFTDDGTNGDAQADDGVYAARCPDDAGPGLYRVEVHAQGTDNYATPIDWQDTKYFIIADDTAET